MKHRGPIPSLQEIESHYDPGKKGLCVFLIVEKKGTIIPKNLPCPERGRRTCPEPVEGSNTNAVSCDEVNLLRTPEIVSFGETLIIPEVL